MLDTEREYLASLLDSVECIEYLPLFEEHDITPDLLPSLDKQSIKEIGINKVGDRLSIQILVKLSQIEKIKRDIPINLLDKSVDVAVNSMIQIDEQIKHSQSNNKTVNITVITQDGNTHNIDITKRKFDFEIKRKILISIMEISNSNNWKIYYIDYKEGSSVHDVNDVELDNIVENGIEKDRLILCKSKESVSMDAINTSNKINIKKKKKNKNDDRDIGQFMGGRPPSQMINVNLREYFPNLDNVEIEDIKRKSMRLSMYSTKVLGKNKNRLTMTSNRDSLYSRLSNLSMMTSNRMSVFSDASFGVGMALKIENHNQQSHDIEVEEQEKEGKKEINKTHDDFIVDEHPNSIIELLDESDEEEIEPIEEEEEEEENMMNVINSEVANGPSVWHKGPKIGQGSFGNVYLGLNGLTGELMAIKQVELPQNESEKSKKIMVNALKQEISLLKELSHENIVRYLGSNTDSNNMFIFLEYVPGGSVSSMLKMYGPFEEELIKNFTRQVLVGLVYLHSKGIIHRDIKGGNILVDNNGSVKIGDFGISKKITVEEQSEKEKKRSSLQGSVFWMAPEVVKQVAYTEKADVWSVGCLVVEMYTGKHPYPGLSQMQAIFQIGTGKAQPGIPSRALADKRAVQFFRAVFAGDYVTRPRAVELLKLGYLEE